MKICIIVLVAFILLGFGAVAALRLKPRENDFPGIAPAWIDRLRATHPNAEIEWTETPAERIYVRGFTLMLKQLTFSLKVGQARAEGNGYSIANLKHDGSWEPTGVLLINETRESALEELERLFENAEKAEN